MCVQHCVHIQHSTDTTSPEPIPERKIHDHVNEEKEVKIDARDGGKVYEQVHTTRKRTHTQKKASCVELNVRADRTLQHSVHRGVMANNTQHHDV